MCVCVCLFKSGCVMQISVGCIPRHLASYGSLTIGHIRARPIMYIYARIYICTWACVRCTATAVSVLQHLGQDL